MKKETEVKKDIEWLKSAIQQNLDFYNDNDEEWQMAKVRAYAKSLNLINQLDEPEVLSQEWIEQNKFEVNGWNEAVHVEDLQNLLVPKQEEVDRAYRKGFKEGKRQTAEYFESITEEPNYGQVQKYLSERGFKVVDKEPETVASVLDDFYKSIERMKKVLSMEVEELEEWAT